MESRLHLLQRLVVVTFVGLCPFPIQAQSDAPRQGTSIIFSAPKSDTVSSNLNEMRSSGSPFQEMESNLKKPFELFDRPPETSPFPALRRAAPTPPIERKKSAKELMNERAEAMFLEPELYEGETDADLYGLSDRANDLEGSKPKTALDRYYERLDRSRTNQASASQLTGEQEDYLGTNLKPRPINPFAESWGSSTNEYRNPFDSVYQEEDSTDDPASERVTAFDRLTAQWNQVSAPAVAELQTTPEFPGFSGFRNTGEETRLDQFKKLLQSPYQDATEPVSLAPNPAPAFVSTPTAAPLTVVPDYSYRPTTSPSANPNPVAITRNPFSERAGLVGMPQQPETTPSYIAAPKLPEPQVTPPRQPASVFKMPVRPF